ncbi:MAG: Ig-like domain-containing protein [Oscillospiraceae bacterium]
MRQHPWSRGAALALLAAILAATPALALFGREKTVQTAPEGAPIAKAITIATYKNVPYTTQFLAADNEGDPVTFALETEPKHGAVTIEGDTFTYAPAEGKTGRDVFTYTATDEGGHCSLPALVEVTVSRAKSPVTYADLDGCPAHAAAIHLAEEGIFTGSRVGEQYFFEPERPVSRGEFLAMTLQTAELPPTEPVRLTGFADDAAIPTWAKATASAALQEGVVQGIATAEGVCFRATAPITLGEAATMLDRVLAVSDVKLDAWYAGRDEVPAWAAQAVGNMESVHVLAAGSFGGAVRQPVTRAEAAQMLSAARTLLDGRQ